MLHWPIHKISVYVSDCFVGILCIFIRVKVFLLFIFVYSSCDWGDRLTIDALYFGWYILNNIKQCCFYVTVFYQTSKEMI